MGVQLSTSTFGGPGKTTRSDRATRDETRAAIAVPRAFGPPPAPQHASSPAVLASEAMSALLAMQERIEDAAAHLIEEIVAHLPPSAKPPVVTPPVVTPPAGTDPSPPVVLPPVAEPPVSPPPVASEPPPVEEPPQQPPAEEPPVEVPPIDEPPPADDPAPVNDPPVAGQPGPVVEDPQAPAEPAVADAPVAEPTAPQRSIVQLVEIIRNRPAGVVVNTPTSEPKARHKEAVEAAQARTVAAARVEYQRAFLQAQIAQAVLALTA